MPVKTLLGLWIAFITLSSIGFAKTVTYRNRPIIDPNVAKQHEKIFRPSPLITPPGVDVVSMIEKLGRPVWRYGTWKCQ